MHTIHSPTHIHLGCFQLFNIVTNVAINVCAKTAKWIPSGRIAGVKGRCDFNFAPSALLGPYSITVWLSFLQLYIRKILMGYQLTPVKGLASLRNTKRGHLRWHLVKGTVFTQNPNAELLSGARHEAGLLVGPTSTSLSVPGCLVAKEQLCPCPGGASVFLLKSISKKKRCSPEWGMRVKGSPTQRHWVSAKAVIKS